MALHYDSPVSENLKEQLYLCIWRFLPELLNKCRLTENTSISTITYVSVERPCNKVITLEIRIVLE